MEVNVVEISCLIVDGKDGAGRRAASPKKEYAETGYVTESRGGVVDGAAGPGNVKRGVVGGVGGSRLLEERPDWLAVEVKCDVRGFEKMKRGGEASSRIGEREPARLVAGVRGGALDSAAGPNSADGGLERGNNGLLRGLVEAGEELPSCRWIWCSPFRHGRMQKGAQDSCFEPLRGQK